MTIGLGPAIVLDKMISIRSTFSARPDSSDCETRLAALREHLDVLTRWSIASGNVSEDFAKEDAFENLLALAVLESGDAYECVKWLDESARWDVETSLVHLFDRVFSSIDPATLVRERAWVMQNGVRFPAGVGQQVVVQIGDERFLGMVKTVERAVARALVDLGGEGTGVWVNAEDVAEVVS